MKPLVCIVAVLLLAGCTDLTEGQPSGNSSKPGQTSPAGTGTAQANGQSQSAPQGQGERQGIFNETTSEILDYHKVRQEKPHVVEVEQRASGSDHLSFAASAYINLRSRPQVLALEHSLNQTKELVNEGRNLTYEQFMQFVKDNHVELVEIPRYQMYAYDEQRGKVVVLEDPKDKAERYEKAGIAPEDQ